jgi:hypothetical protein
MPKFLVELWLDGYDDPEEMAKACEEFIDEQLNWTASSIKITRDLEERCAKCGRVMDAVLTCPLCGGNTPSKNKNKKIDHAHSFCSKCCRYFTSRGYKMHVKTCKGPRPKSAAEIDSIPDCFG